MGGLPPTLLSAQGQSTQISWGWRPLPQAGGAHTQDSKGKGPTFRSFQVPDADGARLGTSYDELLRRVEADTLHRGCVTCQALQREGGSSSELQGNPPATAPDLGSLRMASVRNNMW